MKGKGEVEGKGGSPGREQEGMTHFSGGYRVSTLHGSLA